MKTPLVVLILATFLITSVIGPLPSAGADEFRLPMPGVMVHLSPPLDPPILKGIKVYPDNPFRFEFILDKGEGELSNDQLKDESEKLIKYFLASLTIPEKDLWVNLSPYEKDRLIPQSFGLTEMGRDLLAEDYILKQITASLIYPEDGVGKKFWKRIYEEAAKRYGTTDVPVNTFNKVWIVPEKAVVFENAKEGTAYVVESKLKVMLEQDYLSLEKHEGIQSGQARIKDTNKLGSQIVREIVIPELTTEVNENKNFSRLRQVYNSLILATWYKNKIKDSILSQVYSDKKKVAGVNNDDPLEKEKIYQRYLKAFKKGVYNYIKEDVDPVTQETIPRKYFSGGVSLAMTTTDGKTNLNANVDIFTSENAPSGLLRFIKKVTATSLFVVLAAISGVNASGQNSVNESNLNPTKVENQTSLHGKITTNPAIEKLLNVLRDKNAPGRDEAARQLGILTLQQLSDGKQISSDTSLEDAAKGLYPKLLEEFEKNPNEQIPPDNYTSKDIEDYLQRHPEKLKPSADSLQTEFDTIRYLEQVNPRRISAFISVLQQQAGPENFLVISEFGKLVQESNVELSDSSLYPQNIQSTLDLLENNPFLKGRFTYIENQKEKSKNKKEKSITLILKNGKQAVISLKPFQGKAPIDKQAVLNLVLLGGLAFWHSLNLWGERREKKQLLKATQALMISLNLDTQEVEKVFNGPNGSLNVTPLESTDKFKEEVDNLSRTIEERNITIRARLRTLAGEDWDGINNYLGQLIQDYANYRKLFEQAGQLAQRAPDDASKEYIKQRLQEDLINGFKGLYGQKTQLDGTLLTFNKIKTNVKIVFDAFARGFTLRLFVDVLNSRPSYAPVGYEEPFTTRVKQAVKKSIARGLYTFWLSDINPDEIKLAPEPKNLEGGFSLLRWHNVMTIPQSLQTLTTIEELQNPLGKSQAPVKEQTAPVEVQTPVKESPTLSEEKVQPVIVEKKLTAVEKRNQERLAAIKAEFKRIWVDSKGEATTLAQMRAVFRARALPNFYDKRRNLTPEYRNRKIGEAWKTFGGEALIKEFELESLNKDVGKLGNDVVGEAVGKPDSASLSRREFINKTSLAALFTLALSKYAEAAKLLSPETGLKLEAPSVKASYKEWMSDVLEAAVKLQGSYRSQLKKMGPLQHAGEINIDRQRIEVVLSLLGQIIKTASLEDSGTSPEGKFSTLSSTQGRGMYALASAVSKLRGLQDLNFEDLIEKADQLYGLSSLEDLDLNKNTVLIFPPAAGDPRWRSEYLVKAYQEAGYNVLMYAFDPTQKATEIAEKFYKSMSSPFMKGIMLDRGVTIVGFSAARTYVDQTLNDYGNTGLFKRSAVYMASGNWGGSPKADVSRIPLGKVIRKLFVAGEFKNMVYGEDPNSDEQLSLLEHHSEIVSQVAEYHGTLGYMDKHMPNFSHWFETPTGKYPGTYLLWEAFNGSHEAYQTLKSFYANKKKYTTQSHFLEEVERLQMTYENIDIKQHKGNPYYETVHVAALLSPEGAARAVKATNRFYEKKPAVAVNHAMGTTTPSKFGGIDLTAANMNLQLRNAGEEIKFHLDPAMLQQLQNAPGFTPVIINIQPLNSLQKFLGINATKDLADSS